MPSLSNVHFSHTIVSIQDSLNHPNFFPISTRYLLFPSLPPVRNNWSLVKIISIQSLLASVHLNQTIFQLILRVPHLHWGFHFLSGYQPCPDKTYPPKRQHRHSCLSGSRLVFRIPNLVTSIPVGFCQTKPLPNNIYGGSSFDPRLLTRSFPKSYSSRSKKDLLPHWRVDKHCKQFLKFYVLLSILVHLLGIPFY